MPINIFLNVHKLKEMLILKFSQSSLLKSIVFLSNRLWLVYEEEEEEEDKDDMMMMIVIINTL